MMPAFRRVLAVGTIVVLFGGACGGGDESGDTTAPSTTQAPLATDAPQSTSPPSPTTAAPADAARAVQPGDAISVHYVGTLDNGEKFDSSRDRGEPLSFVVASGRMIPGFDAAVLGMTLGEVKTVRIEAADAYGEWSSDLVQTVSVDLVPPGTSVGDELQSTTGQRFLVTEVTDTEVTLDGNHQLAGEALTFEIELVSFDN